MTTTHASFPATAAEQEFYESLRCRSGSIGMPLDDVEQPDLLQLLDKIVTSFEDLLHVMAEDARCGELTARLLEDAYQASANYRAA